MKTLSRTITAELMRGVMTAVYPLLIMMVTYHSIGPMITPSGIRFESFFAWSYLPVLGAGWIFTRVMGIWVVYLLLRRADYPIGYQVLRIFLRGFWLYAILFLLGIVLSTTL